METFKGNGKGDVSFRMLCVFLPATGGKYVVHADSCWFVMFCAVFMTICRARLAAELPPYHTSMPCVRTLSMEQW